MPCLTWSYGGESGCLDFDPRGQTFGKLCFAGTPKWIPANLFEIYQDRERIWKILPTNFPEVIQISIFQNNKWNVVKDHAYEIEDGELIRVTMDDELIKILFVESTQCIDVSSYGEIWDSNAWTLKDSFLSKTDLRQAERLNWISAFIKKNGGTGFIALATFLLIEIGPIVLQIVPPLLESIPALVNLNNSSKKNPLPQ